ncbi:peptidase domain-containing ABC transporter [Spirulina subsalsa]|uniref:peptidase domain-containing ABC transporter n=1 Tax=Spirulina subsalsa TaxID=54311 RepID=UPI0002DBF7B1|nr:peptidase domain-containing ABC transporter [Spirulina subsalsa]
MLYKVVLQHNEEDCGAACLATIAQYYGQIFALSRVRQVAGTGALGTNLLNLKQGAKALGFEARGVKVNLDLIQQDIVPLPGIIHWQGNHWVVLYGTKKQQYIIGDPAVGLRYLSQAELLSGWDNGVMLLLQPRPDFNLQPDDRHLTTGFQRLKQRFWQQRHLLLQVLGINLVFGLLSLISPFFLQLLTDEVLVRQDVSFLNSLMIVVFVSNLFRSGLRFIQSYIITYFAQGLELDLVLEFCAALLKLPLTYYESHRSGEVASRLRDIQAVNQFISQVIILLPSQFLIAGVSLGLIFIYDFRLVLATLILAAIMTLVTVAFLKPIQQKTQSLLALTAENQGVLIETFKSAILLKTKSASGEFLEEFQSRFGRQAHLNFQRLKLALGNTAFSNLVFLLGEAIFLWVGSQLVFAERLTIGQLVACNIMNRNCLAFVVSLIEWVNQFIFVKIALQRLNDVTGSQLEVQKLERKPWVNLAANDQIIFEDVTFYHPGRLELLKNFSLRLPGGQAIALVGASGCGKSTLVKLLAGLYFPQGGLIRIGPYNLPDLALDCVRQQVVLIPQEVHFWSRSIIDNLSLGQRGLSFAKIVEACRIAQADEFIGQLPNQYQTILGEFGANLSGGQRQRLAIALGIVTDPPILILDESTGSLDPVTEAAVLEQLLAHRQGKTTILISHRPPVIRRADWVVMLENGKVQQQGSPEVLLTQLGKHLSFLDG